MIFGERNMCLSNKFGYTTFFLFLVVLDRITKWLALTFLELKTVHVASYVDLNLVWNRGVSWGMLGNAGLIGFYVLAFFIACVIIFFAGYTFVQYKSGESIWFELFVLAGAISNFFDRIYYGAVIDFVDCYVKNWHWPTFNVADAWIVIGVGGIIIRGLLWVAKKKIDL